MAHQGYVVAARLITLGIVVSTIVLSAQTNAETIPQAMARGAKGRYTTAPSGQIPTMADVLKEADVIVRGTLGESNTYLSDDKMNVYTDFTLLNATVLHGASETATARPGAPAPIVITQLGGTLVVGNLTFKQVEDGLPLLKAGDEGLFCLKRQGSRLHLVGTYYGAFGIIGGRLSPLAGRDDFAREYRGVPATQAVQEIMQRAQRRQ